MSIDIEDYYRRYGPMVLRQCRRLLKNEERALDAMQEVFVNLLRYQKQLQNTYPSSLLYRMATNVCLNMIRVQNHRPETADEDLLLKIASYDDWGKRVLIGLYLNQLFSRERPSTREIMVMLYVDGMTLEQVAAKVGLSVSGVRKRVREFKAKVKVNEGALPW